MKILGWCVVVAGLCLAPVSVSVAAGPGEQVLRAKDHLSKALVLIKARRGGMDAQEVLLIVAKERDDSIAALALGQYLEGGTFHAGDAAKVVTMASRRRGFEDKVAAMAAISGARSEIVAALLEDGDRDARIITAKTLLAVAFLEPEAKIEAELKTLLAERQSEILVPTIHAAALLRLEGLAEAIDAVASRDALVLAARLYYHARIGRAPDAATLSAALKAPVPRDPSFIKTSPLMTSYTLTADTPLRYALRAIGEAKRVDRISDVAEAFAQRDLRVRIDAAHACGAIGDEAALKPLHAALAEEAEWPVRVAIYDAIGSIGSPTSVDALTAALENEKGRFRQDANYALASIAGKQHAQSADGWRKWFAGEGKALQRDPQRTAAFRESTKVGQMHVRSLANFYGARIVSDRVVFVIDTSRSMRGAKITELKENMHQTLGSLGDEFRFNIVNFGGELTFLAPGKLISGRHSERVQQQLDYYKLTLGTRTYDAMEAGMLLPEADTIIYLSDGAPAGGQWQKWQNIQNAFRILNRDRIIAIHTILYGGKNNKPMTEIALDNAGQPADPEAMHAEIVDLP